MSVDTSEPQFGRPLSEYDPQRLRRAFMNRGHGVEEAGERIGISHGMMHKLLSQNQGTFVSPDVERKLVTYLRKYPILAELREVLRESA
jgi:hypothetical protein